VAEFWNPAGSRPGPHPSCAGGQRTRNHGRTADGTGGLPGHAGTDHLDRVQSPAPSNAICERMIGTLRREVFDRLLIVNEHHLRRVLTEYLRHYNAARPHRFFGQLTPAQADTRPPEPINIAEYRIRRKQVLGGLTHEYYVAA
jgi:Integrase core domain